MWHQGFLIAVIVLHWSTSLSRGQGRQCIFCPNKADSQEHIWSDWILRLLPETKDGLFVRKFADGRKKYYPSRKPKLTIGVVCERNCNNGWMNAKLEGPMKSATEDIIIHDNRKILSRNQCATIAAWAFKSTILANHMNPHGEPFFSVEQRRAFAHDLTIPRGVHIWLARRDAGAFTATYWSEQSTKQPATPITPHLKVLPFSPYRFETYVCVLSVGYLLLQVVAARWTERKVADLVGFPTIAQHEFFNDYSIPIWPDKSSVPVSWPPLHSVGNDLFNTFMKRFRTLNIPSWMT
jgi:hypothetical protein